MMNRVYRLIALTIVSSLLLTGCDSSSIQNALNNDSGGEVRLNETINDTSKWINSSIPGAIDAESDVSLKDDFYTAVNKDWLLSADVRDDGNANSHFQDSIDKVKERKIKIVSGVDDPEAFETSDIDIDADELAHDESILRQFVDAATDWERRDELGVEPLRPYIEAIDEISSLDELSSYILNENDNNLIQESLVKISTQTSAVSPEVYSVFLESSDIFTLKTRDKYIKIDNYGIKDSRIIATAVSDILEQFGYTRKDAKRIVSQCYEIEAHIASNEAPANYKSVQKYVNEKDAEYTFEDVKEMQGNYPLTSILEKYGYDKSKIFYVPESEYVKYIGRLYKESNLEKLKSYFIVHTIYEAMSLLTKDMYEQSRSYENREENTIKMKNGDGDQLELEYNDDWDIILNDYVGKYMAAPLEILYISKYCSAEQKQYLSDMVDDLVAYYKVLITEEEWLTEDGKKGAIEKLDFLKKRILYPDTFESYKDIVFSEGDTLLDMVSVINESDYLHNATYVNKEPTSADWNLRLFPTTTVNATYVPAYNGIFIYAGVVASGENFDVDMPYEANLAKIGTVIGHEISHGFDDNGSKFDKYGYEKTWWSWEDTANFSTRVSKQKAYYDTLNAAPGIKNLSGAKLSGEVIADMGGLKAALAVARKADYFDYDLFFKSYAEGWRVKASYGEFIFTTEKDVHPPAFLRVNVVLMQADDFYGTYNIEPGDGMYMAPEDRLSVW